MYFPRGDGPLASFILPTRQRVPRLLKSVESVYNRCTDKSLLEFVFKVDNDDRDSIEAVTKLTKTIPARVVISPRGRGYTDMHIHMGDCAAIARGDWVCLFNDDSQMLTDGWDQLLLDADPSKLPGWGGSPDIALFGARVMEREISWEFPILRRKTFQYLGHLSEHCSCDSWLFWVLSGVNAACMFPKISITHFVNEVEDNTHTEGRKAIHALMEHFVSPEVKEAQQRDTAVLRAIIKQRSLEVPIKRGV